VSFTNLYNAFRRLYVMTVCLCLCWSRRCFLVTKNAAFFFLCSYSIFSPKLALSSLETNTIDLKLLMQCTELSQVVVDYFFHKLMYLTEVFRSSDISRNLRYLRSQRRYEFILTSCFINAVHAVYKHTYWTKNIEWSLKVIQGHNHGANPQRTCISGLH